MQQRRVEVLREFNEAVLKVAPRKVEANYDILCIGTLEPDALGSFILGG